MTTKQVFAVILTVVSLAGCNDSGDEILADFIPEIETEIQVFIAPDGMTDVLVSVTGTFNFEDFLTVEVLYEGQQVSVESDSREYSFHGLPPTGTVTVRVCLVDVPLCATLDTIDLSGGEVEFNPMCDPRDFLFCDPTFGIPEDGLLGESIELGTDDGCIDTAPVISLTFNVEDPHGHAQVLSLGPDGGDLLLDIEGVWTITPSVTFSYLCLNAPLVATLTFPKEAILVFQN